MKLINKPTDEYLKTNTKRPNGRMGKTQERGFKMETTIKVVKVVNKDKVYKDAKGNDHIATNYYNVITINGNQTWVAIRPSFAKGYSALDMIAEVVINGKGQ